MGKIILIASGKGGTGKTTAAANLGAAISASNYLTLAADMDIGLRNLDIAYGVESSVVYDICDVAEGLCSLDEALIKHERYDNLYIMSAPQTRRAPEFDADMFKALWERIKERFDYCIIDAPAGLTGGFEYALPCVDTAIVIATPEVAALRDADRTVSVLEDNGIDDIRLVLNRVRPDLIESGVMPAANECADMLGIAVLGIVPEDDELKISALKGEIAVSNPNSRAGTAFSNIAHRLLGEDVPVMDFEEKTGFFVRLKKVFKG